MKSTRPCHQSPFRPSTDEMTPSFHQRPNMGRKTSQASPNETLANAPHSGTPAQRRKCVTPAPPAPINCKEPLDVLLASGNRTVQLTNRQFRPRPKPTNSSTAEASHYGRNRPRPTVGRFSRVSHYGASHQLNTFRIGSTIRRRGVVLVARRPGSGPGPAASAGQLPLGQPRPQADRHRPGSLHIRPTSTLEGDIETRSQNAGQQQRLGGAANTGNVPYIGNCQQNGRPETLGPSRFSAKWLCGPPTACGPDGARRRPVRTA